MAENTGNGEESVVTHSAVPEAALVFVVFVFYAVWDVAGYRLFRDPEYAARLATPREPATDLGQRRRVTMIFVWVSGFLALAIWLWDPRAASGVVLADALIIVVLLLYRISKQAFDPKVKTRPAATPVMDGSDVGQ